MTSRCGRTLLGAILCIFAVLSATYSVLVPPFEASDELWHYPMVKYIADHGRLPVQDPGNVGPWRQEGSQAPLYYAIGALATCWIDTSDMDQVRHLNPHADNGVATPDGNVNLIVHDTDLERFPWQGTVLAVHLIRFLSVLMGTAAVYLTWLIVREVFPGWPHLALGAAAVHAFTPMVVFIAGSVNNDNLVILLSSLSLLLILRLLRRPAWTGWTRVMGYGVLGCVLGLTVLTKSSSLALTLITACVVAIRAVRHRSWSEFLVGGIAAAGPVLILSGWWFVRNLVLYGDLTGLNVFIEILGQRDVPADLAQLWRERYSFAAGYWGNFGGLNVPMPSWVYHALNALVVCAVLGLLRLLVRWLIKDRGRWSPGLWPLVLCLLWGVGVVVPWSQWAAVTWSSQGRLIFPALPVWSALLVLGLTSWAPTTWRGWVTALLSAALLSLAVVAPFAWIRPVYALPHPLSEDQITGIPQPMHVDFDGVMRLLGYSLEVSEVQPGDWLEVTLYWEAIAPTEQDHTVFVHLLGEGDLLIAQRDTFPGLGRLSTTWLQPGFRWADRYVLQVPATAYTPDSAVIDVGLYEPVSGERLRAQSPDAPDTADSVRFGRVAVVPIPGVFPNPMTADFGGQMALVGYDVSERVLRRGDSATLTLYWKAVGPIDRDYTVSAQFVDFEQHKAAQKDSWPQDGMAPTSSWQVGQIVADERILMIGQDAPFGVYDVRVAVYSATEEGLALLPVIPEGGRMQTDYVVLTGVRVAP